MGGRPPALRPRNGRAGIEPAEPPPVHPRAAPGQHRPAVVGDAFRLSPRRGEIAGDGMIIVMRHDATPAQVAAVVSQVELHGCRTHLSDGDELYLETCRKVRAAGAHALRGGVFKPRTSPYSFQGLRGDGINILREAKRETGLPLVCEVLEPADIGTLADIVDVLQIGARNMQNFPLLSEVGRLRKPVLLKRGMSATIEEWLLSAEYILSQGNYEVILCERGIRTFETYTRNTLDLNAV